MDELDRASASSGADRRGGQLRDLYAICGRTDGHRPPPLAAQREGRLLAVKARPPAEGATNPQLSGRAHGGRDGPAEKTPPGRWSRAQAGRPGSVQGGGGCTRRILIFPLLHGRGLLVLETVRARDGDGRSGQRGPSATSRTPSNAGLISGFRFTCVRTTGGTGPVELHGRNSWP